TDQQRQSFHDASPRLAGTTPDGFLAEATQNMTKWNYQDYVSALKTRPVLVLESNDTLVTENKAFAEALRKAGDTQVTETHFDTDHVYSGKRIALQTTILNWLAQLAPTASK